MKAKIAPTIFAAALVGSMSSFAQTSVTSEPVGFVNVSSPGASDTPIGLPLHRSTAFQTTVSSVAGNVISVNATLGANQFVRGGTITDDFYLRVKSTVNTNSGVRGAWYAVTANNTTSITVDPAGALSVQAQGLAANDTIEVIPFWTLDTLFPNGQGIAVSPSVDNPQDIVGFMPATQPGVGLQPAQTHIYSTDSGNGPNGWYDASALSPTGTLPIEPDSFLFFRNSTGPKSLTITGSVPMGSASSFIGTLAANTAQDNFTANPLPVPISLPESRLFESGAFAASSSVDTPTDVLLVYDGTETGFGAQPSATYIYSTDASNGPVGWYDASSLAAMGNTKVLLPGRAFVIRKAAGTVVTVAWRVDATY